MSKILLIEDDIDLSDTLIKWLSKERYTVEAVSLGREGLDRLRFGQYDLVILDWTLPDITGVDILNEYRREQGKTPILMLTGKGAAAEKATGLDAGADDYLTKPFSLVELSARLRALLRRSPETATSNILQNGDLWMDPRKYRIMNKGTEIHLLPREFSLLEFFLRHPDEVFSAEVLLQRVWHTDSNSSVDGVRTCIKRLREKIDPNDEIIDTVPRIGYRFRSKPKQDG